MPANSPKFDSKIDKIYILHCHKRNHLQKGHHILNLRSYLCFLKKGRNPGVETWFLLSTLVLNNQIKSVKHYLPYLIGKKRDKHKPTRNCQVFTPLLNMIFFFHQFLIVLRQYHALIGNSCKAFCRCFFCE